MYQDRKASGNVRVLEVSILKLVATLGDGQCGIFCVRFSFFINFVNHICNIHIIITYLNTLNLQWSKLDII